MQATAVRFWVIVGAAVVAMALFGVGTAAADPYVGKTYAEASARIADKGGSAVVETVVGSQLPTDQCIVESWHRASYTKDNFEHDKKKFLLAINCVAKLAHAGLPGNSLATPEGRARKAVEEKAERFNTKPASCEKNLENCLEFCNRTGLCSKEVMALF